MEIPDLVAAVSAIKAQKIIRYRQENNRASNIGYSMTSLGGCVRRGVYDRTHWDQKEMHDINGQYIFDEGHQQERQLLRDLDEAGIKIIGQQEAFTIYDNRPGKEKNILLTGTVEGKIVVKEEAGHAKETLTFEIKSMNPNIFQVMHEFDDFKKKPWTLAYMAQGMAYMLGKKEDEMLFILKDKSNGTLRQILVPFDPELANEIITTAREINDHIEAETYPDRIQNVDKCKKCPHKKYCLPDIDFEVGPSVADDPDLARKIRRYMQLIDGKKECDKLYKESIAPKLKVSAAGGKLDILLEEFRLGGSTSTKGAFTPKIRLNNE